METQYKKEVMNQLTKQIKELRKEIESNNFSYCKVGRAITI